MTAQKGRNRRDSHEFYGSEVFGIHLGILVELGKVAAAGRSKVGSDLVEDLLGVDGVVGIGVFILILLKVGDRGLGRVRAADAISPP